MNPAYGGVVAALARALGGPPYLAWAYGFELLKARGTPLAPALPPGLRPRPRGVAISRYTAIAPRTDRRPRGGGPDRATRGRSCPRRHPPRPSSRRSAPRSAIPARPRSCSPSAGWSRARAIAAPAPARCATSCAARPDVVWVVAGRGPFAAALARRGHGTRARPAVGRCSATSRRGSSRRSTDSPPSSPSPRSRRAGRRGLRPRLPRGRRARPPGRRRSSGGVPDAVHDGETGILVDPDDRAADRPRHPRSSTTRALARRLGAGGAANASAARLGPSRGRGRAPVATVPREERVRVLHVITRLSRRRRPGEHGADRLLHRRAGVDRRDSSTAEAEARRSRPRRCGKRCRHPAPSPRLLCAASPRRCTTVPATRRLLARLLRETVRHRPHPHLEGRLPRPARRRVCAAVPVVVHTPHGHVFHSYYGPLTTRLYVRLERCGRALARSHRRAHPARARGAPRPRDRRPAPVRRRPERDRPRALPPRQRSGERRRAPGLGAGPRRPRRRRARPAGGGEGAGDADRGASPPASPRRRCPGRPGRGRRARDSSPRSPGASG